MMHVPAEIKQHAQWIAYRIEVPQGQTRETKVPYNPITGFGASSVDPSTWLPYDVVAKTNTDRYNGPGFMLSHKDGYTFIDLDNPWKRLDGSIIGREDVAEWAQAESVWASHLQIVAHMASYTEWSPSGTGLHIIVRGTLSEDCGNRIGKVEIYSHSRFMTMTGNHFEGSPLTIEDRQGALDILVEKLGLNNKKFTATHESQPETRNDAACVNTAMSSKTAELFNRLWSGDITGYPSHSEADLALANLICFQTDNTAQAERIFRASPYYTARAKLHSRPELVARAIQKGMDQKAPPIDTAALLANAQAVAGMAGQIAPTIAHTDPLLNTRPPGLLGDVAAFLYEAAPRPVREVALAGAIGLMAGICGRSYNVSRTGLNQYVVLLGSSGIGKESISSGISRLMRYITDTIPAAEFFVGPSHIASAPALLNQFGDGRTPGTSPSFFSLFGEFGKWLAVHTSDRAQGVQEMLVRSFLDLWAKSGRGNVVGASVYADKAKNVRVLDAPAFSFIGETVPGRFYDACTADAIEGGLIPRFLIVEYVGMRPALNKAAFYAVPSYDFVARMKSLCERSLQLNHANDPIDVKYTAEAEAFLDDFDAFCDRQINASPHETVKAVWNRSHLKALKLAALIAVGKNWLDPVIELSDAQWAKAHVVSDAHKMLSRFDTGNIVTGSVTNDRERSIVKYVKEYLAAKEFKESYNFSMQAHALGIIPVNYIINRGKTIKAFKNAGNRDPIAVIKQTLIDMCDTGVLIELTGNEPICGQAGIIGTKVKHYMIGDRKVFEAAD